MENVTQIRMLDKLINKFILEARKFIVYAAFPYGTRDLLLTGEKSVALVWDFEYFVFTKSTKTLLAIRELLKKNHNEDVFILIRSMLENYISCRYLNENDEKINDFIENPLKVTLAYYNINSMGEIINRETDEVVGIIDNPSKLKLGKDKMYFYSFYDYLSRFSHCNYGVVDCYVTERYIYTYEKINYPLLSRLFTIFVFTKIFEHIVTVEGEDFIDARTERNCYKLVSKSLEIQNTLFEKVIMDYSVTKDEFYRFRNKRMKEMLKDMKKSLSEELGSVIKS